MLIKKKKSTQSSRLVLIFSEGKEELVKLKKRTKSTMELLTEFLDQHYPPVVPNVAKIS